MSTTPDLENEYNQKTEECQGCYYETEELKFCKYGTGVKQRDKTDADGVWLCELCRSTPLGNIEIYRSKYSSLDIYPLVTMNYIGNTLLAELRKNNAAVL